MSEATTPLRFDPGKRRQRSSACTCLCGTVVVATGALLLLVLGLAASAFWTIFSKETWPHTADLHNSSDPDLPVIPLWTRDERFNVGVTVWLKGTEAELNEWRAQRGVAGDSAAVAVTSPIDPTPLQWSSLRNAIDRWNEEDSEPETALFSDVVFSGVRLRDKNIISSVNFILPTARFCAFNVTPSDLRASFFLIPTSLSLFDHVTKWSHWIPSTVVRRRVRPWPFPLGSSDEHEKTMRDSIIEAGSITVPLVQLRSPTDHSPKSVSIVIGTPPNPTQKQPKLEAEKQKELTEAEEDYDEDDAREDDGKSDNAQDMTSEEVKEIPQPQPFIVTRTQLRLIDDQSKYALKAFNKRHNRLKATSCGQDHPSGLLNRRFCNRNYGDTGPFETRLRLEIPQVDGSVVVQRAHLPFYLTNVLSNGVLDLERVPVNRTNMMSDPTQCIQNPSINVTWHVSFSGRTPAKSWFADRALQFLSSSNTSMNSTDREKAQERESLELAHALGGHRYHPESHTRRRFLIGALSLLVTPAVYFLDIHYWWTIPSTVGIATTASIAQAVGYPALNLLLLLSIQASEFKKEPSNAIAIFMFLVEFIVFIVSQMGHVAMLKGASQLSVTWGGRVPKVERAMASHWERASTRLDRKTSRHSVAIVFTSVLALNLISETYSLRLIPSLLPPLDKKPNHHVTFLVIGSTLTALNCTYLFAQISLNRRARTFAGRYKLAALLDVFDSLIEPILMVPVIGGRWEQRPGWGLKTAATVVFMAAYAYQAWTLPNVPEGGAEEE